MGEIKVFPSNQTRQSFQLELRQNSLVHTDATYIALVCLNGQDGRIKERKRFGGVRAWWVSIKFSIEFQTRREDDHN